MASPSKTKSPSTVVGLFRENSHAEQAIRDLKSAGFTEEQIGVAMRNRDEQQKLMEDSGSQAAEGAATGAMSGGIVGGLIGLLGSLLIPGVGPIVVGGVLASTLAGAGIGAATGGLIGALMGLGLPEEDARHFDTGIQSGGILVTVNAGTRSREAVEILRSHGADLGPSGIGRYGDFATGVAGTAATAGTGFTGKEQEHLELREEQLDIDKRQVKAGEARVRKEVISEQRNIEVPVTREELVVERRPASGREASAGKIGESEEIRVPLMEEEVDVKKRAVVREEVDIGKRKVQETRNVSDTVRREEARIDTEGEVGIRPLEGSRSKYQGKERRRRRGAAYSGPERRMSLA